MSEPGAFPAQWDNSACATHAPDAPRYYVDHETVHDRITGTHVYLSVKDIARLLNLTTGAKS